MKHLIIQKKTIDVHVRKTMTMTIVKTSERKMNGILYIGRLFHQYQVDWC